MIHDTGLRAQLYLFARALNPYPYLQASVIDGAEQLALRVKPVEHPLLAEDITCVPDDREPGAVIFRYSWGQEIPGSGIREKAAAIAYVLQGNAETVPIPPEGTFAAQAEFTLTFTAEERAISLVRHLVIGAVRLWEMAGIEDSAAIIVSELATNSVREAPGALIWVRVAWCERGVLISCWDPSPQLPAQPVLADVEALGGRGIHLVSSLADDWGIQETPDDGGKVVFALIALPEEG